MFELQIINWKDFREQNLRFFEVTARPLCPIRLRHTGPSAVSLILANQNHSSTGVKNQSCLASERIKMHGMHFFCFFCCFFCKRYEPSGAQIQASLPIILLARFKMKCTDKNKLSQPRSAALQTRTVCR